MTKRRDWPNSARFARNRAAEEINTAVAMTEKLLDRVKRGEFTRAGLERDLLYIAKHQITAVRHLESVGAETLPE